VLRLRVIAINKADDRLLGEALEPGPQPQRRSTAVGGREAG
jgi:hypothetical protein